MRSENTMPQAAANGGLGGELQSQLQGYIDAGFVLTSFPNDRKGPMQKGWNLRENCISTRAQAANTNGHNIGLCHAYARTCAIDVDNYRDAEQWLLARGADLNEYMMADDAVQIRSGRAKLLYRLPEGVEPLPSKKVTGANGDVIDFRCGTVNGVTIQDVLPPSIHPDTGEPYEWGGAGDFHNVPELPDALIPIWRSLPGGAETSSKTPPVVPDDWQSVDLCALDLPNHLKQLIREGNDKYPSRSEMIYGAIRDLISAGCDDETICFVMTDPQYVISEKALEQTHGDVQAAMLWMTVRCTCMMLSAQDSLIFKQRRQSLKRIYSRASRWTLS